MTKNKGGRPTRYTEKLGAQICALIMTGQSLREVCRREDMPSRSAVFSWLAKHEEFADQYARACLIRQEEIFDEIFEIADDGSNDWMLRRDGDEAIEVVNHEVIQRSRLRIDARKWALSKMNPRKYGEKLDIDQTSRIALSFDRDESEL
jgi:Bacteriophage Sf6, terminase small subunit-like